MSAEAHSYSEQLKICNTCLIPDTTVKFMLIIFAYKHLVMKARTSSASTIILVSIVSMARM